MPATIVGPSSVSPGLPGGIYAALNLTAAQIVKATPGILLRATTIAAGSAGSLTFNDNNALTGNTSANQILTIPFGSLVPGQPIFLEWPCGTGIVASAVPTGSQIAISFS